MRNEDESRAYMDYIDYNPVKHGHAESADHTAALTADVKFPICKYVTVAPKIAVWLPLSDAAADFLQANSLDTKSTHVVGGINLSATF